MSINDDVVQSYGHVASMRRLSEGVAAAVEAETAAFLDGQDMAGAVGRRAALSRAQAGLGPYQQGK
jgi:hypothetical protein